MRSWLLGQPTWISDLADVATVVHAHMLRMHRAMVRVEVVGAALVAGGGCAVLMAAGPFGDVAKNRCSPVTERVRISVSSDLRCAGWGRRTGSRRWGTIACPRAQRVPWPLSARVPTQAPSTPATIFPVALEVSMPSRNERSTMPRPQGRG
jgi:hypothetical protein